MNHQDTKDTKGSQTAQESPIAIAIAIGIAIEMDAIDSRIRYR
jgi:hypothetical protein